LIHVLILFTHALLYIYIYIYIYVCVILNVCWLGSRIPEFASFIRTLVH
jgi:hypothetical protein